MTQYPVFTLRHVPTGLTFFLRVTSMGNLEMARKLNVFSVNVVEDEFGGPTERAPHKNIGHISDFAFVSDTEHRFSDYCSTIKGSENSFVKLGAVKEPLVVSRTNADGNIVDYGGAVKQSSRQFTLECLISKGTSAEALDNYYALLGDLLAEVPTSDPTRKHAITIKNDTTRTAYLCYYTSQSVLDAYLDNNKPWLHFAVTFTIIGSVSYE